MGLTDPRTGRRPYAVVPTAPGKPARAKFQPGRFSEPHAIWRAAAGVAADPRIGTALEFLRYGQIHRNTYINGPALLTPTLQLRSRPEVFFAGQISGVEGYVESIATGLMAGVHAAALARDESPRALPRETALGSLCHYVSGADARDYQPANITFDLLPQLDELYIVIVCAATKRRATPRSVAAHCRLWMHTSMPMCEAYVWSWRGKIEGFLEKLKREAASENTVLAYAGDLARFLAYLSPPELGPPEPRAIDQLLLREWMASLYKEGLNAASIQRKLAAVRSLFKFMLREGVIEVNVARLVRTPKPQKSCRKFP